MGHNENPETCIPVAEIGIKNENSIETALPSSMVLPLFFLMNSPHVVNSILRQGSQTDKFCNPVSKYGVGSYQLNGPRKFLFFVSAN